MKIEKVGSDNAKITKEDLKEYETTDEINYHKTIDQILRDKKIWGGDIVKLSNSKIYSGDVEDTYIEIDEEMMLKISKYFEDYEQKDLERFVSITELIKDKHKVSFKTIKSSISILIFTVMATVFERHYDALEKILGETISSLAPIFYSLVLFFMFMHFSAKIFKEERNFDVAYSSILITLNEILKKKKEDKKEKGR